MAGAIPLASMVSDLIDVCPCKETYEFYAN